MARTCRLRNELGDRIQSLSGFAILSIGQTVYLSKLPLSYTVGLDIWKCESSSFVHPLQDCMAIPSWNSSFFSFASKNFLALPMEKAWKQPQLSNHECA